MIILKHRVDPLNSDPLGGVLTWPVWCSLREHNEVFSLLYNIFRKLKERMRSIWVWIAVRPILFCHQRKAPPSCGITTLLTPRAVCLGPWTVVHCTAGVTSSEERNGSLTIGWRRLPSTQDTLRACLTQDSIENLSPFDLLVSLLVITKQL